LIQACTKHFVRTAQSAPRPTAEHLPVIMTQLATCLSLLALLSSFPLSLGSDTHISGSSLIGVSSVSEILDQFFKKQEISGRKAPAWKKEAQSMISLLQSLKDINATTQATVDGYVRNIIETLQADVNNTKAEQASAKTTLDALKNTVVDELRDLDQQLTKVKTLSGQSKACRDNVTTQNTAFYSQCSDNDADEAGGDASRNSCPRQCGHPSAFEFELKDSAKKSYTCDFEAGQTAQQCVADLWEQVNKTRTNLTNKYNAWATKKRQCEEHMTRCATCNPLWKTMTNTIGLCNGKRNVSYDAYCTLQKEQTDFCNSNETLHSQWTTALKPAQDARVSEYSDLEFIICIFEKYFETKSFTQSMVSNCVRKTAADFYSFATPTGELVLPNVDASAVPQCFGAVSHASGNILFDMTGLINEFQMDESVSASTVSIADHVYAPATPEGSKFCTVLTR